MNTGTQQSRGCSWLSRLWSDDRGAAMVEFAFAAPIVLTLGLGGIELAYFATTHMQISQTAMQVADNASRIGDRNALAAEKIYESDINDLLAGAQIYAGSRIDLFENGRVIISSLERNDEGGQWIHWQRCLGKLQVDSAYGPAGTGETGTEFPGMGVTGQELTAPDDGAVMYVEVIHEYEPLISARISQQFVEDMQIRSESAFTVRGSRDLTGVFAENGVSTADCDEYEGL